MGFICALSPSFSLSRAQHTGRRITRPGRPCGWWRAEAQAPPPWRSAPTPTLPPAWGPRPELRAQEESGGKEPPLVPWEEAGSCEAEASSPPAQGAVGAGLAPAPGMAGLSGDACREHIYNE